VLAVLACAVACASLAATHAEARMIAVRIPRPRFDPRVLGEVVTRPHGPPPISGGTLQVLPDGHRVVVADPDRDRVLIVDLDVEPERAIVATVEGLPRGAEPGRSAVDAAGRVHVVLRGAGALVSFDPAAPERAARRAVCPMPRGIAYDAATDALHVACRGGELVTMPATSGAATRTLRLEKDLRDVILSGGRLHVTRFRSAEILVVGEDGRVASRHAPADVSHDEVAFAPAVAWRAISAPDGSIAMLHQRESRGEISPAPGGYGSLRSGGCEGIVRSAITTLAGGRAIAGPELANAVLPVDLALAPGDAPGSIERLAVVAAGNQSGMRSVIVVSAPSLRTNVCTGQDASLLARLGPITNAIAVAYAADRRLVVQQRDPARLVVVAPDGASSTAIALGGSAELDTGHAIFHAATEADIACASCHPEGGEDGHVWRFTDVGRRRTPALHAVAGTAPFHWSGELADVRALMTEVFVRRMGGGPLDQAHQESVERWLAHVPRPRATAGDAEAIARGRAVFEGAAECATCHSGPLLTNLESADVGTGGSFQVPSLIGVGDRLPIMHDGCAETLRARFEPRCGGDRHGEAVSGAELSDLLAYLESL
jgi:cytochrome c553